LEVLDGVVDCPNRIVIMTSNHPEKLDPALVRPGRINKKIYLGYMGAAAAVAMIEHYYCDVMSAAHKAEVRCLFGEKASAAAASGGGDCASLPPAAGAAGPGANTRARAGKGGAQGAAEGEGEEAQQPRHHFTPAEVEQQCAEHDDVPGLLQALRRIAGEPEVFVHPADERQSARRAADKWKGAAGVGVGGEGEGGGEVSPRGRGGLARAQTAPFLRRNYSNSSH
jgi:hypothetical protein